MGGARDGAGAALNRPLGSHSFGSMEQVEITAALDPELRAGLDQVAAERGLTSAEYATEAIRRAVESDGDFLAFVQEGIDDLDAGRTLTHEQLAAAIKHRRSGREAA